MNDTQLAQVPQKQHGKECKACSQFLPLEDFYLKQKGLGRRDSRCRFCRAKAVKSYRLKNPDRVKAIQQRTRLKHAHKHRERAAKWYLNNREYAKQQLAIRRKQKPETIKNEKLRAAFGITLAEYHALLGRQNGQCAICGIHYSACKRMLAVDHCHKTGKVRGLLCSRCNTALGSFQDSTETLLKAVTYLKHHE